MKNHSSSAGCHIEKELLFEDRHAELSGYLSEMEGTYARCQHKLPEDLEQAYRHVFEECAWCRQEFEELKKLKNSFHK